MSARRCVPLLASLLLSILAVAPASAQYSFDWDVPWQGAVKDMLILEDFMTELTNTSAVTDSFKVTLVKDMPLFWQATICEGPVCYPPSVTEHTFILGPGASTNLDFAITAAIDEGSGSSIATVESLSDPGVTETNTFTIVTSGLDVLVVDASEDPGYLAYYEAAIASYPGTQGSWDRDLLGGLAAADMAGFGAVVWYVGTSTSGLTADDRVSLRDYVGGGGSLFLSGQNLANDYCSVGGPSYTPESRAWFNELLGADFQSGDSGASTVYGAADDPVTAGLVMSLNGGDGAGNNLSPDVLTTLSNGMASLTYDNAGPTAGVRGAYREGRTFFVGFAFEGLATGFQRDALMSEVLDWFLNRVAPVGSEVQPPLLGQPSVTPNPFNPQTSLRFEIGGSRPADTEVVIYDLRGRAVRNLFRGTLEPGPRTMNWNGRDDDGRSLPSGVYLTRVLAAGEMKTVKMTLAR
jgi:hypothetical protein